MIKIYFSYDENFVLTGYSTENNFEVSDGRKSEAELTQEQYEELTDYPPCFFKYNPSGYKKITFSQEQQTLFQERMIAAQKEEVKVEELQNEINKLKQELAEIKQLLIK